MSMETCWELAQRWYTGRDKRDWLRPTAEQIQQLFTDLGLDNEFWQLS